MTITTETTRDIHEYHSSLVASEGLGVPYTMTFHFRWEHYLVGGFTKTDLAMVVGYIKRRIREGKRQKESLLLRNLIENHDTFAENLSMARSESRAPKLNTDRASVLRATGRADPEKLAMRVDQVINERLKLAQMLKEFKSTI